MDDGCALSVRCVESESAGNFCMVQQSSLSLAQSVLSQRFGFSDFRGCQGAVIEQVLGGQHALVIMPTGGGKSLCFQVPASC